MRLEFELAGYDVQFVSINMIAAETTQDGLVSKAAFPLFQDTFDVGAWEIQNGKKDDFFIYAADGTLGAFLPHGGEVNSNLSTEEGYANLRDAIIGVF